MKTETMMKLNFVQTPYGSIRVWVYFDENLKHQVLQMPELVFFKFASIWGGADKEEKDLISFELPLELAPFIQNKFGHWKECTINIQDKYLSFKY